MMAAEVFELNAWKHQLQQGDKGPKRNLTNLMLHLRHLDGLGGQLRFNEMTHQAEWRGKVLEDPDYIDIRLLIERAGFQPTERDVRPGVDRIAREHSYNPVAEYLTSLTWDGVGRLERWMIKLMGAPDTDFVRCISPKVLISAVARALDPGCQVDTVLVLEGDQGIKKSTAISVLFGRDFTRESVSLFGNQQKMVMSLMGAWVVELAEFMAVLGNQNAKGMITMRYDTVVLPYAKAASTHPRRSVMFATINPGSTGYLEDATGNRRFWPVPVEKIDIEGIRDRRDQLWAEALHRYRANERWWLEGEENKLAGNEQDERGEEDAWTEPLRKALVNEQQRRGGEISVITADEAMSLLGIPHERKDKRAQMRAATAIKEVGFERKKVRPDAPPGGVKGKPKWSWVR